MIQAQRNSIFTCDYRSPSDTFTSFGYSTYAETVAGLVSYGISIGKTAGSCGSSLRSGKVIGRVGMIGGKALRE